MSMITAKLTARQQKALATKARIAETAMHLFSEQGFAATSTKQIAQAAGRVRRADLSLLSDEIRPLA